MKVTVGTVGKAHGLRGEVAVLVRTDDPDARFTNGTTYATKPKSAGPLTIARVRRDTGRYYLMFDGVADRTDAESLRGVDLVMDAEDTEEDDAWYPAQLRGLRALSPSGGTLGEVVGLVHLPAQDALEVREPSGTVSLVPFVHAIVPTVDVEGGFVVIDAPAGLLADDGSGERVMRVDVVTVFPDFFNVLDVSLLGKARESGLLDVAVHDLRDWTTDRRRTVDDSPLGGGAGMVMRPDVWGTALDEILTPGAVLVIPTPAGEVFSQALAVELAVSDQLVFACGRYEGIDDRVAEHYRGAGVDVREVSLGDYVLNGGEVAALAIIEAVARLVPGMVGNAESLSEESHTGGLLEYPMFTRPRAWRGLEASPELLSGDHAAIARWRRDEALRRTAARRPDLALRLDPADLDSRDLEVLAGAGVLVRPRPGFVLVRPACGADADELAALAARTFPRACPPAVGTEDIAAFIAENLRADQWLSRIADPDHSIVLVAVVEGELAGYTWVKLPARPDAEPTDPDIAACVRGRPQAELSKIYVDAEYAGSGISGALFDESVARASESGAAVLWLGTNAGNSRARAFYKRHGMKKVGTRTFYVGDVRNDDVVMSMPLR